MHLHAVDRVDKTTAFPAAARGGREDDNVVAATDEPGRKIMDLHLDSAQARQIAVR
jgi:hypothetical protein